MSPNRRGQNLLPPPMKTRKYAMKPSEWLPYQILGGKIDKNVQIEPQTVNKVGIPWPKTGATYYPVQQGLQDISHAIKGLAFCNS